MVTEDGVDGSTQAGAVEWSEGGAEQAGVEWCVDRRAVIEGVGVGCLLDADVGAVAAGAEDAAALEDVERLAQLVGLSVVDQVAALDHGVGGEVIERLDRTVQDLAGEGFLGAEGGVEWRAEATQEGDASG